MGVYSSSKGNGAAGHISLALLAALCLFSIFRAGAIVDSLMQMVSERSIAFSVSQCRCGENSALTRQAIHHLTGEREYLFARGGFHFHEDFTTQ